MTILFPLIWILESVVYIYSGNQMNSWQDADRFIITLNYIVILNKNCCMNYAYLILPRLTIVLDELLTLKKNVMLYFFAEETNILLRHRCTLFCSFLGLTWKCIVFCCYDRDNVKSFHAATP